MYNFYYDESEHSKVINLTTINANNFFDNFTTVFVGWVDNKEHQLELIYKKFENTYKKKVFRWRIKKYYL